MGRAGRERERNIGGNKTTTHTLSLSPSCGLWVEFCISFLQFSGCSVATAWYSASLSSQSRRRNEGRKRRGAVVNQSRPLDSPLQLQFITLCLSLSDLPSLCFQFFLFLELYLEGTYLFSIRSPSPSPLFLNLIGVILN